MTTEEKPKRLERRCLNVGDVILYDVPNQQYDMHGNIDRTMKPYTRTGIMLISGFDYDADEAARCSVGRSAIGLSSCIYGSYSPHGRNYRKAKKHHIKKFIRDIQRTTTCAKVYAKEIETLSALIDTKNSKL